MSVLLCSVVRWYVIVEICAEAGFLPHCGSSSMLGPWEVILLGGVALLEEGWPC